MTKKRQIREVIQQCENQYVNQIIEEANKPKYQEIAQAIEKQIILEELLNKVKNK